MSVEVAGQRPLILWAEFDSPDPEPIAEFARRMREWDSDIVLGFNYSPNKDWNAWYDQHRPSGEAPPTYNDLHELGYRVIWHTILSARAAMAAYWDTFQGMAVEGATALLDLEDDQRNEPVADTQGLSGARHWMMFERFVGGAAASKRLENSGGFNEAGYHQDRVKEGDASN
jgi:isocitrate lyase